MSKVTCIIKIRYKSVGDNRIYDKAIKYDNFDEKSYNSRMNLSYFNKLIKEFKDTTILANGSYVHEDPFMYLIDVSVYKYGTKTQSGMEEKLFLLRDRGREYKIISRNRKLLQY